MTTREDLHTLIDCLPEGKWEEANQMLLECLEEGDAEPVLYHPLESPEDEPTPAEIAAVEEAYAALRTGRAKLIPHEEVMKRLLELP